MFLVQTQQSGFSRRPLFLRSPRTLQGLGDHLIPGGRRLVDVLVDLLEVLWCQGPGTPELGLDMHPGLHDGWLVNGTLHLVFI